MEREVFLTWLSEVDRLSEAQKVEVSEVFVGCPAGKASLAAVEMGVGEDRTCPHCDTHGSVANGKSRGLQRYLCQSFNRIFGVVTSTLINGLHRKELWLTFGECLANGDTVAVTAKRCGLVVSTDFRWRHRFLAGINTDKLKGIIEADETFFQESRKGDRVWTHAKEGKPTAETPDRKAGERSGRRQNGTCPMSRCRFWPLRAAPARPSVPSCLRSTSMPYGRHSCRS